MEVQAHEQKTNEEQETEPGAVSMHTNERAKR